MDKATFSKNIMHVTIEYQVNNYYTHNVGFNQNVQSVFRNQNDVSCTHHLPSHNHACMPIGGTTIRRAGTCLGTFCHCHTRSLACLGTFLPRDTMLVRYILSSCVRLYVSLSITFTSRHCTKTAKRRITQTTPYDSPVF